MIASLMKRITQLEPPPPWGFFSAVNTAFVPLLAVFIGTLIALSLFSDQGFATLVAWLIGAMLTIVFVFASRRTPEDRAALQLDVPNSRLFIILLLSLGVAIVVDVMLLAVTGQFLPVPELAALTQGSPGLVAWLLAVIFMLVAQPLADELVFRGVFFPAARYMMGAWGGLIVTSMIYALFHYLVYPYPTSDLTGLWYALISPLFAGLFISGVRANSGSTRAAVIAHLGFNLFALLKLLVLP